MKECDKCGEEIKENAIKCPECGSEQENIGELRRDVYIGFGVAAVGLIMDALYSPVGFIFTGLGGLVMLVAGGLMQWRKRKIKQR